MQIVSGLQSGGADHAFECAGLVDSATLALRSSRPGGTTTLVGMAPMGHAVGIDIYRFVEDGKRLLGSNYGSSDPAHDFPLIAADIAAGRLPLGRLIDETIALRDIEGAFDAMRRRDGARRVVLYGD